MSNLRFNLLVSGAPFDSLASYKALKFCKNAIENKHWIEQVFFYQQGVHQANSLVEPLADEFNALDQWLELAREHKLELITCISASERRGVMSQEQSTELDLNQHNLHPAFKVAGLGLFHEACLQSDRTITFK